MAEVHYIRHETNTKGRSYASVARQMNVDPRTVKKYSEMEDFNPEVKTVQTRRAKVMDPVKSIVDQWLLEDLGKKKKFRRTAKRIYTLLVSEHGFQGSDRTVRALPRSLIPLQQFIPVSSLPFPKPGMLSTGTDEHVHLS